MPRGMNIVDLKKALNCRSHSSAVKEKAFVGKELDKKLWVVRVAILLLEYIKHLQRIWLSPLLDIPQVVNGGDLPNLIDSFCTFSFVLDGWT